MRICFTTGFAAPFILLQLLLSQGLCQDSVEFLNGSKLEGKILEIRKDAKEFDLQSQIGGQQRTKTYPYSQVHAVTLGDKRFVLTPTPAGTSAKESESSAAEENAAVAGGRVLRSKQQVLDLIDEAGKSPPDWFDSADANHPASLDLDWPQEAKGPWDESKNVGQYIWGRVNPNEARWHGGIKLVHECMKRHENNRGLLDRDMDKLGEMYFTLLQDYARAAFWLQKAKSTVNKPTGIHLAECYWRLGNEKMALDMLRGKSLHLNAIKLLGDMDRIDDALRVASIYGNTPVFNEAFLNAGDALRNAGRLDQAIEFYQKVLDKNEARNEEYKQRYLARASGAIEAIQLYDRANVSRVADGTYRDASTGYNGRLEVEVNVAEKRIKSVKVTKHTEKQFYAAISDTTQQIVAMQSIQDIDGTSGATITSEAILHATARALAQGAK